VSANGICVLHCSNEINDEEHALDFVLVAVVYGSHPLVTIAEVKCWLETFHDIPSDRVIIKHYHLEDFLITFSSGDDMMRVLHQPPPPVATSSLTILFKRWCRQLLATVEKFLYRVLVQFHGVPAHA
jgi:hypothetical protein